MTARVPGRPRAPTDTGRPGRLAARQQVADQPRARAGRDRRRPERRTPSAALARHPADGRRPHLARHAASTTPAGDWAVTPGAWDRDADVDCGLAGTVMRFVPPVAGLAARHGRLRRRPPHAPAPGRPDARPPCGALGVRVDDGGRGALPFAVHGTGSVPGRHRHDRRQRLVAVRLRAAARGRPLRPRRRRAPRRQAGAVAPPHRDDRADAAPARGRGRRQRRQPLGRRARARSGPSTTTSSPTCPTRPRSSPSRAATGGRVTVTDWPAATTQPGDELREILALMGCEVEPDRRRPHRGRPAAAARASTSTCTTSAS